MIYNALILSLLDYFNIEIANGNASVVSRLQHLQNRGSHRA